MTGYQRSIRLFSGLVRKLYRVEVVGHENIPPEGTPYLLCSNHITAMDPVVLVAAIRQPVRFFAKAELFRIPILRRIIRSWGAIPVHRGTGDIGAVKNVLKALSDGSPVGVFPQGHRYPGVSPRKTEPRAGIGLMVSRSGVPILPVYLETKKNKLQLFRKTRVIIGQKLPASSLLPTVRENELHGNNMENYRQIAGTVFDKICCLEGDHFS